MNDEEFAERPSGFMIGKEFMIVLVIIFSGLSFTLGFFVGKNGAPKPEPLLHAVEPPAQVQKQEMSPVPPSPVVPASEQTQAGSPLQQAVQPPSKEPASLPAQDKEKPAQQKSSEARMAKSAPEATTQKAEPAAASESKTALYTVQIGAFRNLAEAKQLKAKFEKRGYKSFISEGTNRKAQKIFKVKTGEFTEKKEAEVLALKLKKTEGLQTYVTMKTE